MPTAFLSVKNNAVGTLLNDILSNAVSLELQAGEGALFPGTFLYHISINNEILSVGGKSGDVLTGLIHAREGTSASDHAAGAAVELLITAQQLSDIHTAVNTLEAVDHDAGAIAAVPFVIYIPFGSEESYAT